VLTICGDLNVLNWIQKNENAPPLVVGHFRVSLFFPSIGAKKVKLFVLKASKRDLLQPQT